MVMMANKEECQTLALAIFGLLFFTKGATAVVCNSINPVPYDPNREVCCNGSTHIKRNVTDGIRRNYECCARPGRQPELYDVNTKLCCGTQLIPKGARTCCEGKSVVEEGGMCCGGKNYTKKEGQGCCSGVPFDMKSQTCCEVYEQRAGKIYLGTNMPCCGLNTYDPATQHCPHGVYPPVVKPLNIRFYEGTFYDKNKKVPCVKLKDEVNVTFLELEPQNVSFPIEYQCCNKTLMNPDHEKCCRENVKRNIMEHIIRKEDLCCGNSSVRNSPTQKCRQGVPQTISSEATNQNYKWCGKEVISTGEKCCNNKKIPLEEECCGGKEPYKLSSVMSCCGGEVYNTSVSVCCQRSSSIKEVVAKVRPDDTACCWKTQTPYNHYNEKCTDKGITRSYRRLQPSSCPICDTALSKALCKKRFVHTIYANSLKIKRKGRTIITAFDENTNRTRISIPLPCACIKTPQKYAVFTNRKVKSGRLKLKDNDRMIKFSLQDLEHIKKGCETGKKVPRKLNRLIRKRKRKTRLSKRRRQKIGDTVRH